MYPLRIPGKISEKFGNAGGGGGSSLWTDKGGGAGIYYDGKVGIGDFSAQAIDAPLHIDNAGANGGLIIYANNSHIDLFESDESNKQWRLEGTGGSFAITEVGAATRLTVAAGGNVGIGTSTMVGRLNVYESVNGQAILFLQNPNNGTAAQATIQVANDSYSGTINLKGSNNTATYNGVALFNMMTIYAEAGTNGMLVGAGGNKTIYFGTNSTIRMAIFGSGDISVGSTSLVDRLYIYKSANTSVAVRAKNPGTGTSAYIRFALDNDVVTGQLALYGTNFASSMDGVMLADVVRVRADAGANGLILDTASAVPVYIATNDTVRASFTGTGEILGKGSLGKWGYAEANNVAGTSVDLVPNGAYDCVNYMWRAMTIILDSTGQYNLATIDLNGSGDTNVQLTQVGNAVTFTMNADGSVSVARSSGTRTFDIVCWYIGL